MLHIYIYRISVYFSYIDAGINHSGLFHLSEIMRVSALFLINEIATMIDPCINTRKKDTYSMKKVIATVHVFPCFIADT